MTSLMTFSAFWYQRFGAPSPFKNTMHGFWKLVSAFLLTCLVHIEAQCDAGYYLTTQFFRFPSFFGFLKSLALFVRTGWNGTKCSSCYAGYYCEGGSGPIGPSGTLSLSNWLFFKFH
jgi:hypothetical protein